jgi:hypothetical protein
LVHHSDRGIQYASAEYVEILKKHGIAPSMSRPANPYDNASCESFIKTLKREEIYANEHENLEHLRDHIEEFIERYYNQKRLHSALGHRSPEEFEQQARPASEAASLSATVAFYVESTERSSTGMLGEGTQTQSLLPDPIPARRINEMTSENEQCGNLYKGWIDSSEGFTQNTPARCRNKNCLNGGVHPNRL